MKMSSLSVEAIRVRVSAMFGGLPFDLSTLPVSMAVVLQNVHVQSSDFVAGTWDVDNTNPDDPIYRAECVFGPLSPGDYMAYVMINNSIVRIADGLVNVI